MVYENRIKMWRNGIVTITYLFLKLDLQMREYEVFYKLHVSLYQFIITMP